MFLRSSNHIKMAWKYKVIVLDIYLLKGEKYLLQKSEELIFFTKRQADHNTCVRGQPTFEPTPSRNTVYLNYSCLSGSSSIFLNNGLYYKGKLDLKNQNFHLLAEKSPKIFHFKPKLHIFLKWIRHGLFNNLGSDALVWSYSSSKSDAQDMTQSSRTYVRLQCVIAEDGTYLTWWVFVRENNFVCIRRKKRMVYKKV